MNNKAVERRVIVENEKNEGVNGRTTMRGDGRAKARKQKTKDEECAYAREREKEKHDEVEREKNERTVQARCSGVGFLGWPGAA